jgi:hypothetical protein
MKLRREVKAEREEREIIKRYHHSPCCPAIASAEGINTLVVTPSEAANTIP